MKTQLISVVATAVCLILVGTGSTQWVEQTKLTGLDTANILHYGRYVSISGRYCIVGAFLDDENGEQAGAAYIFKREGASWIEQAKLLPSDGKQGDSFGFSVSMNGEYAIVGAYGGSNDEGAATGCAYIFKREDQTWIQQAKLTASDGWAWEHFGQCVSISGDYCVVGAPQDDYETGSAYVFKREGMSWTEQAKLTASDGDRYDEFGWSVSISGDYAIVGAVYDEDRGYFSGSAYIFKRVGTNWIQQRKLTASDGAPWNFFGISVSISENYAIVGARGNDEKGKYSGAAYIFSHTGTTWVQQSKLMASDGVAGDMFGWSVEISGGYVIVGAFKDDDNGTDSGSAYIIFNREGTSWIEQAKLKASDGAKGDSFGRSVSISGKYAVVDATYSNPDGNRYHSAYVFTCERPPIEADIDINPNTLNLASKGKWITCYIWLPEDYNVADINSYSVFLEFDQDEIGAEWIWFDEEEQVAMAKFNRSDVQVMLVELGELGEVELMVSGELVDGARFEGTDTIRVIDKPDKAKP